MRSINIIVMGKTGAGKSTLINAVLREELALTGIGQAVTRENKIYKKEMMLPTATSKQGQYGYMPCRLSMYDTVGLEIDSTITDRTLGEIQKHVSKARESLDAKDISVVWFCISELTRKFEPFELELIKKLSIDYELPFVIVITQSISRKKGELEKQIEEVLPDVPLAKVLAKEYPIDDEVSIPPRGIESLLRESVNDYQCRKISILETKINQLDMRRTRRIHEIEQKGMYCIQKHSNEANKIGIFPGGCIPFVHGICIKMMVNLNDIAGIKGDQALASDIFVNAVLGIMVTPFLIVPFLSRKAASAYVETVGESYLKVLLAVIDKSTDKELKDHALMTKRIKDEIKRMKK